MAKQGTPKNTELEYRKFFLDAFINQKTSHSRFLIGFAVLLFTILELTASIPSEQITPFQLLIALAGIFLTSFALWYVFLRYFAIGVQVTAVMNAKITNENVTREDIPRAINNFIETNNQRILFLVKTFWFKRTGERQNTYGAILCFILALASMYALSQLIGIEIGLILTKRY